MCKNVDGFQLAWDSVQGGFCKTGKKSLGFIIGNILSD